MPGILYVVGTPIGNLEDMTLRALRVLREVDLVAAEDTRHSRKLLSHFDIHTPLLSIHEHNERKRAGELVDRLHSGMNIALVTDAGSPTVSDPGGYLVHSAVAAGVTVVPIPGASAVVTAVMVSALPCDRFAFDGFLPRRGRERQERLNALATEERAVVIFESPQRLLTTLQDLERAVGQRPMVAARELTKKFEEVARGTAAELLSHFRLHEPKGEFTLIVAGVPADKSEKRSVGEPHTMEDMTPAIVALHQLEAAGHTRKDALKNVARRFGIQRRLLYNLLVKEVHEHEK